VEETEEWKKTILLKKLQKRKKQRKK
jgi:hypothetical protein